MSKQTKTTLKSGAIGVRRQLVQAYIDEAWNKMGDTGDEEWIDKLDALEKFGGEIYHFGRYRAFEDINAVEICEQLEAAQELCKIYFDIAAEAIGEDQVRRKRDEAIKKASA